MAPPDRHGRWHAIGAASPHDLATTGHHCITSSARVLLWGAGRCGHLSVAACADTPLSETCARFERKDIHCAKPRYNFVNRDGEKLLGVQTFTRIPKRLAAVASDAVVVASPVMFHGPQIMAALEADRHVLTEKCFTVGLAEAEPCVAEAERREHKLMVVQNWRRTKTARTLRRLVAKRTYGPPGLFMLSYFKARGQPYHASPHMHLWQ